MLKYVLILIAALAIEVAASLASLNFMFETMTSETTSVHLYLFGCPIAIFAMAITIALFESCRDRIVADQNVFRVRHG